MPRVPDSITPDNLRHQLRDIQDSITQNKVLLAAVATAASEAQDDATAALAAIAAFSPVIMQTDAVPPSAAPATGILFYTDTTGPTVYVWSASNTTWYEIPKGGSIVIP